MTEASTMHNIIDRVPSFTDLRDGSFKTSIYLPAGPSRIAEGGLRTRRHFKQHQPDLPLISIITVVYNGEAHLEDTLRSVMSQTWTNIEYIVVDGGSKDRTVQILKEYDDRIDYWVSEKDNGISDAFNKGIACAIGDFVGLVNADDWYEPGTVEAIASISDPTVGVVCGRIQYWKHGRKDYEFESDPSRLEFEMTVNHPTCFVRRDIYQRWGVFSDNFKCAMDYELLLRFKSRGVKFLSLSNVLANMRLDGTSDKYWRRSLSESREAKIELLGHPIYSWAYWLFQYTRRIVRDTFLGLGFQSLICLYRKHFSILAKHQSP